jgi:hypothetical protein
MKKLIILLTIVFMAGCATTGLRQAEETGASKPVSGMEELESAPDGTDYAYLVHGNLSRKITVDNFMKRLESELSSYAIARANLPDTVVGIVVFDADTEVTVGDKAGSVLFRIPSALNGYNLVDVEACHFTASTGASGFTSIEIYNTGTSQLADMILKSGSPSYSVLRIDANERDSKDAVINASYDGSAKIDTGNDDVATGDQLRIDVDSIPTGGTVDASGLYVEMHFRKP